MSNDVYDSAAQQLQDELTRQFPRVRWRVPSSADLQLVILLAEQDGYTDPVAGNWLIVQARLGDRAAISQVTIELIKDNLQMAATLVMGGMRRQLEPIDAD